MKEKLSKKERNQIYREAREFYKEDIKHTEPAGICAAIGEAILIVFKGSDWSYNCYVDILKFPEIMKHKPFTSKIDNFWWSIYNTKIRIKILNEAVKETND